MELNVIDASFAEAFQSIIRDCDNCLFDCDGVLWHDKLPVEGAVKVINLLQKLGKRVLYITNNSTKTRDEYVEKLSNMGFSANRSQVFGTAYTSALCLKHRHKIEGKVYVVGNESMAEELNKVGINHFGIGPDNDITYHSQISTCSQLSHSSRSKKTRYKVSDSAYSSCELKDGVEAVLVGFDGNISFTKMLKAASYLGDPNCLYVATNDDQRMPMKNSKFVVPGTGCMVNSVSTAAGRLPDVLCGKPGVYMFECIQKEFQLNPDRTIMIGDRMNTDVLFGKRNKLKTLLVFTGIESKESLEKVIKSETLKEQLPDYYMSSIGLWASLLEKL